MPKKYISKLTELQLYNNRLLNELKASKCNAANVLEDSIQRSEKLLEELNDWMELATEALTMNIFKYIFYGRIKLYKQAKAIIRKYKH